MKNRLVFLLSAGLLANMFLSPTIASAQLLSRYDHPYTSGLSPRVSGGDFWPDGSKPHFQEPPGYDSNPLMHPYTSGLGPCPQGQGKTVCTEAMPPTR